MQISKHVFFLYLCLIKQAIQMKALKVATAFKLLLF
jgi:hypothetical protein